MAISRALWEKLKGSDGAWAGNSSGLSSGNNDFNYDDHVSFTPEELKGKANYNYAQQETDTSDQPGVSVFYKGEDGSIYHTYSAYARGIDILNTAYHYLDLVPKGRDEEELEFPMAWVRHHDKYDVRSAK